MNVDPLFHLYLLVGQSNMAGRGQVESLDVQVHPRVWALDRVGRWCLAADPIHFDKPMAGVGPGLTFGKTMAERCHDVRVGLIPCAAGGSPITIWKPGGFWEQTHGRPYDDAIARTCMALREGVLKGILWHQGESDCNEIDAPRYQERLIALIEMLRKDLDAEDVPFVCATLGDFVSPDQPWPRQINDALRGMPEWVERAACVDAAGLGHKGDEMHFDAQAARELGRRYALAMVRFERPGERG